MVAERRGDGVLVLGSADPLGGHAPSTAHAFRACALAHPGPVLAAQRDGDAWISFSWGAAREQAERSRKRCSTAGWAPGADRGGG